MPRPRDDDDDYERPRRRRRRKSAGVPTAVWVCGAIGFATLIGIVIVAVVLGSRGERNIQSERDERRTGAVNDVRGGWTGHAKSTDELWSRLVGRWEVRVIFGPAERYAYEFRSDRTFRFIHAFGESDRVESSGRVTKIDVRPTANPNERGYTFHVDFDLNPRGLESLKHITGTAVGTVDMIVDVNGRLTIGGAGGPFTKIR